MIVQLYDHAPIHYCAQPFNFEHLYVEQDNLYRMVVSSVGVVEPCERAALNAVFAELDKNTGLINGQFIDLITFKQGKQKIRMSMALVSKKTIGADCIYEIESTADSIVISGVFNDDIDWCSNPVENKKTKSKRKATGKITHR